MNHYETLGVSEDASDDEIKKTYRGKAQECHPDKGGDEDEFKQLAIAYAVIGDPRKREHYDRTGEDDKLDPEREANAALAQMFLKIVGDDRINIEETDIADMMRDCVVANMKTGTEEIGKVERKIARLKKAAIRMVKVTTQPDPVSALIESQVNVNQHSIEAMNEQMAIGKRMLVLLEDYTYDFTPPQPDNYGRVEVPPFSQFVNMTGYRPA